MGGCTTCSSFFQVEPVLKPLQNSKSYKKLSRRPHSIQFHFDSFAEHTKMKLFIILYFLVQTNAFRVPLPYGTGIPSSGQGIGNQGIFDLISTWFADPDDNSVQGN